MSYTIYRTVGINPVTVTKVYNVADNAALSTQFGAGVVGIAIPNAAASINTPSAKIVNAVKSLIKQLKRAGTWTPATNNVRVAKFTTDLLETGSTANVATTVDFVTALGTPLAALIVGSGLTTNLLPVRTAIGECLDKAKNDRFNIGVDSVPP